MNLIGIDWDRVEEVELIASIMTSTNLRQKTLHSLEINMAGVTTQKWVVNGGVENRSKVSDVSKGRA